MVVSQVRSSLPYQVFLHVSRPYSALFFIAELCLFLFKALWARISVCLFLEGYGSLFDQNIQAKPVPIHFSILPYPNHVIICELLIILLFGPVEALRIFWGRKGNLTETPAYISFSLLLSIALIAVCVYWAVFQSYVLLIEFILVCIEGALIILQSLLAVFTIVALSSVVVSAAEAVVSLRNVPRINHLLRIVGLYTVSVYKRRNALVNVWIFGPVIYVSELDFSKFRRVAPSSGSMIHGSFVVSAFHDTIIGAIIGNTDSEYEELFLMLAPFAETLNSEKS